MDTSLGEGERTKRRVRWKKEALLHVLVPCDSVADDPSLCGLEPQAFIASPSSFG